MGLAHVSRGRIYAPLTIFVLLALAGCGGGGGGTNPQPKPPQITAFSSSVSDIMPGDSILITYAATGADSLVLTPPRFKVEPTGAGSFYRKPSRPVKYVLTAYNNDGRDSSSLSITMSNAVPVIQTATLDQDTIAKKDTAQLTYSVLRADSTVVSAIGKLPNATSGVAKLSPPQTSTITMISYNSIGSDTASFTLWVEVPSHVIAINGLYYKGTLGGEIMTPLPSFKVTDIAGHTLYKPWVHFSTDGDGSLRPDSTRPDANGISIPIYRFSDTVGHAVIAATSSGADTARVAFRADIFVPGPHGQAQYVTFDDKFSAVKALNGNPVQVDHPFAGANVANYESTKGIVFWINDANSDTTIQDNEDVLGAIVTTIYPGKTVKGIGIGSAYQAVIAAYGTPDSFAFDATAPPAYYIDYRHLGLYFYGDPTDTSIIQMEGYEVTFPTMNRDTGVRRATQSSLSGHLRLWDAHSPRRR